MKLDEARAWLARPRSSRSELGPRPRAMGPQALERWTRSPLARHLLGGLTAGELVARRAASLRLATRATTTSCSRRCPNHMFTRDTKLLDLRRRLAPTRWPCRPAAARLARGGGLPLPPALRDRRLPGLVRRRRSRPWVRDDGGRRRSRHRQRRRAGRHWRAHDAADRRDPGPRLFARRGGRPVVAVELPNRRAFMHLDTVLTMVDRGTFVAYPAVANDVRTWPLTPDGDAASDGVQGAARGLAAVRTGQRAGPRRGADPHDRRRPGRRRAGAVGRRQQRPRPLARRVVAYERNVDTNTKLRQAGVESSPSQAASWGADVGGPRCMSCPLVRDAID